MDLCDYHATSLFWGLVSIPILFLLPSHRHYLFLCMLYNLEICDFYSTFSFLALLLLLLLLTRFISVDCDSHRGISHLRAFCWHRHCQYCRQRNCGKLDSNRTDVVWFRFVPKNIKHKKMPEDCSFRIRGVLEVVGYVLKTSNCKII